MDSFPSSMKPYSGWRNSDLACPVDWLREDGGEGRVPGLHVCLFGGDGSFPGLGEQSHLVHGLHFSSALRFPFMTSNLPESPLFSSSLCGIVEGRLRSGSVKALWGPFHLTRPLRSAAQKAALGRTLGLSPRHWRTEASAWPVGGGGVLLHRPREQPRGGSTGH